MSEPPRSRLACWLRGHKWIQGPTTIICQRCALTLDEACERNLRRG